MVKDILSYNLYDIIQGQILDKEKEKELLNIRKNTIKILSQAGKEVEKLDALFKISMFYMKTLNIQKAVFPLQKLLDLTIENPNFFNEKYELVAR